MDNKYQEWLNANPNLQGTEDYSIVQDAAVKFNVDNPEEVTEEVTEQVTVDPIEVTPKDYAPRIILGVFKAEQMYVRRENVRCPDT